MLREDVLAEVGRQRVGAEQVEQHVALEQVDAHAGQVVPAVALDAAGLDPLGRRAERLVLLLVPRGFSTNDSTRPVSSTCRMPNPATWLSGHRQDGDGDVRVRCRGAS